MAKNYSDLSDKTHVALIHETWRQSVARDLSTVFTFILLWSFGHYVESAALEWAGIIVGIMCLFARVLVASKRTLDKRMTPDQAREWLDAKFPKDGEGQ